MSDRSAIEWTDATWNPIRTQRKSSARIKGDIHHSYAMGWHCEHVSEGCRNCYAEAINRRLGTGLDYKPGHRDDIEIFLDEKTLLAPLRWKKPRKIFPCSMTDLFGDWVMDEMLDSIFAVMALCPQHVFQVLTKRPERMQEYCGSDNTAGRIIAISSQWFGEHGTIAIVHRPDGLHGFALPNVWLGASVEDRLAYEQRWPHLRQTPAAIRFISYEPALGPLSLLPFPHLLSEQGPLYPDWLICGGESGSNARPMHPDWARKIRDDCEAAGTAFFFKQWGEHLPRYSFGDGAGDSGWGDVPEFDGYERVGKKAAGRLLDGVEHNGMPR